MRIGLLTQWYDPEPGPAALPGVYAREFLRAGHDVRVLTGYPNYPTGRIYDGYRRRMRMSENLGGADVTRVWLHPSHDRSAVGRVMNYASFALSATALAGNALKDVDVLWVYNSPITVKYPLMRHSRHGRVPYFLQVQDLWPDSLINSGMFPGGPLGSAAEKVIRRIVRVMEAHAAVIGVASPSVREIILERNPRLDPARIIYAPNPADESVLSPERAAKSYGQGRPDTGLRLMYAGAIGDVQGLDIWIDAMDRLREHPGITLTFVGDGISRARLEQRSRDLKLTSVRFVGRVPKEDIPQLTLEADAQIVSLGPSEFLRHTMPSKIASLLAAGSPIIARVEGDAATLLRESRAAAVVDSRDPTVLAAHVSELARASNEELARMGQTGSAYYSQRMSARSTADAIVDALTQARRLQGVEGVSNEPEQ